MIYALAASLLVGAVYAQSSVWGQCGGIGWTGPTTCTSGNTCTYSNPYYSQCLPGSNGGGSPTTTSTTTTKAATTTRTTVVTKTMTSTVTSASATSSPSNGMTKYAGINIAGFDFGCTTDGSCDLSQTKSPATGSGSLDGIGQMKHFVNDDKLNAFRLPVAWQYLSSSPGGTFNSANIAAYDKLVQGCLATGASCIIDIHNYARWNGQIIGQGGPTNAQFAATWSQFATKYASQRNVIFGIMNEPHDIPNISTWAASVQAAVTAIRNAGATSQLILLPGNDYTSAGNFISNGSGAALLQVKNPDGSTTGLIFDVHKYLDSDNSGTNSGCVTNNISSAFQPLATWLRSNNRQAFLSETGGGNVQSCVTYICQELAYLNSNSDVYIGYTTWAAGEFASSYVLTEGPSLNNGVWTDTLTVKSCIAR